MEGIELETYRPLPSTLTIFVVLDRFLLEVLVQHWAEFLLQTVRIESEQTLQPVAESFRSILVGYLAELVVHGLVEVLSQEEGPESE